jgi:recombinational DNA repair ATPase RecF
MASDASDLRDAVLSRLTGQCKGSERWDVLVLAALQDEGALQAALDPGAAQAPALPALALAPASSAGVYLRSIACQGFRGIGPRACLELQPGPGLTLVVGRNGSGKSSFAEGLELLLTDDTFRFRRSRVWREGWRNLHHGQAALEAEFLIDGEKAPARVSTSWAADAPLEARQTTAQIQGQPQSDLSALGWRQALVSHRPFLPYSELGSMLDQEPSKLYDALAAILGLEELVHAQDRLAEARKVREKAEKEAKAAREERLAELRACPDERARPWLPVLDQKQPDLEAAALLLAAPAPGESEGILDVLRALTALRAPEPGAVAGVVEELRQAKQRLADTAVTLAARSGDLAALLEAALAFHEVHGDRDCPVCGRREALDEAWQRHSRERLTGLRQLASAASAARQAEETGRREARGLPVPAPAQLERALLVLAAEPELLAATQAVGAALGAWRDALGQPDMAAPLAAAAPALLGSIAELRSRAADELLRREDVWRPLAGRLAAWLEQARRAREQAAPLADLKKAEKWLKDSADAIRNERFQPLAQRAQDIWAELRQQSSVALGAIRLAGTATQRRVQLAVTVDEVEGAALGVMSQGELNALALALFIPRATLAESPFRFLVIDDPVQSMDPARVEGLARVLAGAARDRQVVVFTHDDRLPEAVRRLEVKASIVEVVRRARSAVETRLVHDPVRRYLSDALAVAQTEGLPLAAGRRVVPGLCRLAVEAAATVVARRKLLVLGRSHADVEELLAEQSGTRPLLALALFGPSGKPGDVSARLLRESREFGEALRWCNEGAHEAQPGPVLDRVRQVEKLAKWVQGLK